MGRDFVLMLVERRLRPLSVEEAKTAVPVEHESESTTSPYQQGQRRGSRGRGDPRYLYSEQSDSPVHRAKAKRTETTIQPVDELEQHGTSRTLNQSETGTMNR